MRADGVTGATLELDRLGIDLAEFRHRHMLNTPEVAQMLGCSPATVWRLEAAEFMPRALLFLKVCTLLHVEPWTYYETN